MTDAVRQIAAPVSWRRGYRRVGPVLEAAGLVRGVAWTWEARATDWHLVAVPEAAAVLPALPWVDEDAPLPLADMVRSRAIVTRLDVLPRLDVLQALAATPDHAEAVVLADGSRWHIREAGQEEHIEVAGVGRLDLADLPAAFVGDGKLSLPVEHLPALASRLEEGGRHALAASLRFALLLGTVQDEPDLRLLSRTHDPLTLHPDLLDEVVEVVRTLRLPHGRNLYRYQQIGVAFAHKVGGRCLIADSPGVGKTAQALCTMLADLRGRTPALVVTPASVTGSWADETERWGGRALRPYLLRSARGELPRHLGTGDVVITSWGLLAAVIDRPDFRGLRTLVLDEGQFAKHATTQRSAAAGALAKRIPHCLVLTGTPVENRIDELAHMLHMLDPDVDMDTFRLRYRDRKRRHVDGRVFRDEGRALLPELREDLRHVMLRRLKSDVLEDLPPKTVTTLWLDLDGASHAAYDTARREVPALIAAGIRRRRLEEAASLVTRGMPAERAAAQVNRGHTLSPTLLSQMAIVVQGHLRRAAGRAKVPALLSWTRQHLRTGEPLIVFTEHHDVRDAFGRSLQDAGIRWSTIDGDVSQTERTARVAAFQAGDLDVVICGLRSASTGITLTRASHVLVAERALVPAIEEQATDRAHRIGQKNPVFAFLATARGTVDERLQELAEGKQALIGDLIGSERVRAVTQTGGAAEGHEARIAAELFRREVEQVAKGGLDIEVTADQVRAARAAG